MDLEGRSQSVEHRSKRVAGRMQCVDGLRGQIVDRRASSWWNVESRVSMGLEGRWWIVDRRAQIDRVAGRMQSIDGFGGQMVDGKIVKHRLERVAGGTQRVERRQAQRVDGRSQSVN